MAKPRVKADADGEVPTGAKEGGPGAAASVGVTLVNRAGPEAETGKGAEMGMVSGAEAGDGSVVQTEMGSEDDTGTGTVEDTGLARGEELGTGIGEEAGPGSEDGTGRGEEMVKGAAPGAEALTSGVGLWTSLRSGLTRVDVGMGARAVPRAGVGSRPGVNVGRGVNTAGSPELGGRGAGANGGTGVSPSRGACLTTIFTTPVLFTMVGGTTLQRAGLPHSKLAHLRTSQSQLVALDLEGERFASPCTSHWPLCQ